MQNKIIIYGGSSLISKYLFLHFYNDNHEIVVFCRNKEKVNSHIKSLNLDQSKFVIHEVDLEKIDENFKIIDDIKYNLKGIVWVAGFTGDPTKEIDDSEACKSNYNINLIHPVLILNRLIPKLSNNSFISVITSVAGVRGRAKRLFYCSAKAGLINYLSGMRQNLNKRDILVNTVIPGYISTENFQINAAKYLIASPKKTAEIIFKSIKKKKKLFILIFFGE